MRAYLRKFRGLVLVLLLPLMGCAAVGAGAGGAAGSAVGCGDDRTKEECAAATGVGAVGGAVVGGALD